MGENFIEGKTTHIKYASDVNIWKVSVKWLESALFSTQWYPQYNHRPHDIINSFYISI